MAVNSKVASAYVDLVARTESFQKALDDANVAVRKFTTNMRAETEKSREAVRLLSESMGLGLPRALTNVISKLPAVTTAMNLAFDAVIVIGVIHVVVDLTEKVMEFARKNEEAAKKNVKAWESLTAPLNATADLLRVTNDKLEEQIAKLEHKPENLLKTALDEAVESADKLHRKLIEDIAASGELLGKAAVGWAGKAMGKAGTDEISGHVTDQNNKIANLSEARTNDAKQFQDRLAAVGAPSKANKAQRDEIGLEANKAWNTDTQRLIEALRNAAHVMGSYYTGAKGLQADSDAARARAATNGPVSMKGAAAGSGDLHPTDYSSVMTVAGGMQSSYLARADVATEQQQNLTDTGTLAKLKVAKDLAGAAAGAAEKAAKERLRAFEVTFAEEKAQYGRSVAQERAYWESKLSSFKVGSSEYNSVQDKYFKAAADLSKYLESVKRSTIIGNVPESVVKSSEAIDKWIKEQAEDLDRTGKRWDEYNSNVAKASEQAAVMDAHMEELHAKIGLATGALGPHAAAVLLAQAHMHAYNAEIAVLRSELAKLKTEGTYDRVTGQNLDPENAKKQQNVQGQIDKLGGEQKIQALTDAVASFDTTFKGAIDGIFDEVIKKSKDTASELQKFGSQMINSINSELAKGMTGQHMDFGKVFQSGAQQLSKMALEKTEGMGAQLLGLGGVGKMGTKGNPMYTKSADGGAAGLLGGQGEGDGASKGLLGMLNNSDWSTKGWLGNFFGEAGKFGGAHALGGAVAAGVPIDVGELGRERFTPSVPGYITPNRDMRGGNTIMHIDARGTDPALTQANFQRSLVAVHRQAVGDATAAMAEHARRVSH